MTGLSAFTLQKFPQCFGSVFVMSRGGDVQGNGFDMNTASSNGDVLDLQQSKPKTRLGLRLLPSRNCNNAFRGFLSALLSDVALSV
jgi:hypothetical protein